MTEHRYETMSERMYAPYRKHPELFGDTFREEWLHPDMVEIVKSAKKFSEQGHKEENGGGSSSPTSTTTDPDPEATFIDPQKLSPYLQEETWQVYSFQCWTRSFLDMMNEELANFYETSAKYDIPVRRPNSSK